ncbi:MAG: NIPSNAP family protein [Flavisolibacter sp.]|nr:NIPSNAP family protein [Flavisolibacter sp.]
MKKLSSLILLVVLVLSVTPVVLSWQNNKKKEREFHQLTVYHFSTAAQEKMLDAYFQNALIPALHKAGIKNVGVFKSLANDTIVDKLAYVFIPLRSLNDVVKLKERLKKDAQYNSAAADFLNANYKTPAYKRAETIVLHAFELAPQMQLPSLQSAKRNRVYELRSYESATEKKLESKVKMFNQGDEIGLFKRLNFNAVFYSEVVAGSKMPNLMYMTCFENMQERDAHWKAFFADSAWKKLTAMEEYKNNVSRSEISFLYPTDYSDF